MQLKSLISFSTIIFLLLFAPKWSNAESFQENPLTKAILLFDKEKFSEAEPLFKKILDQRPDDFMVNYFYGACRTENGHYSDQDLFYLEKASKEVTPLNIDYYLGVQYHAKNQWEKALAFYKLYKTAASENDQERVNLSLKIEQCSNKINPFKTSETVEQSVDTVVPAVAATGIEAVAVETIETADEILPAPQPNLIDSTIIKTTEDTILVITEQALRLEIDSSVIVSDQNAEEISKSEIVQPEPVEEQIEFNINDEITYILVSNFKTEEGKIYFKEGTLKQKELEEIVKETENLRGKYKTSKSYSEKDSLGQKILALESQTYELKSVVDQLFLQAKSVENGYWQNATPEETERFINELSATAQELNNKNTIQAVTISDSPELIIPPVIIDDRAAERSTPKSKPSGIVYKIQLGAYSRGIPNNLKPVFSKISVIRKVENYTDEKGVVVYTTGNLSNYEDAVVMQNQIRQEGIKDPIIAAYLNGKRITLEQAKEIEKEK
ncbi:MAG TPA: hypothetical protein VLQ91_19170 [Draconibacterium sp.]|nr:hypothetical protein [Draconibacterium sp.]